MNHNFAGDLDELLCEEMADALKRESSTFDRETKGLEDLILFGVGVLGRKTLEGLRKLNIHPLAFCDNDPDRWSTSVDGVTVLSPTDAVRRFGQRAVFVLTIWRDIGGHPLEQIIRQLSALGSATVVSVVSLYWKYPETFLPYFCIDLPHKTLKQADAIRECMGLWADDRSREEFIAQLRLRLKLDFNGLSGRALWKPYLPDELFHLASNEMFVDCGAFDGDTLRDFLAQEGTGFEHYFAIEPDPANFEKLLVLWNSLQSAVQEKITPLCLALSSEPGVLRFGNTGTAQSSVRETGEVAVQCARIDDLFERRVPTYIKMDIEGSERDAIRGATRIIRSFSPVLAICVYHRFDDLWKLPLLIHSLSKNYQFYLRPQADAFWDLVCYAVPKCRNPGPFHSIPL